MASPTSYDQDEALIRKIQNLRIPASNSNAELKETTADRKAKRGMKKVTREETSILETKYRKKWAQLNMIRRRFGLHSFEYDDHKWKAPERWWYSC
jgi:hypothetical protein